MAMPMVAAGWYQDPAGRHQYRYWDGATWSGMVSDNGAATTDLLDYQPPPPQWSAGQGAQWPAAPPAAPAPAAAARRRPRWAVPAIVISAALVLVAVGVLVWAPWTKPPVLQPIGLAGGTATTSSVAFRWSPPASGPVPDKYLILSSGHVIGSVQGSVTSYQASGLAPETKYQYRVVAERGGIRSPRSALITVATLIPPVSDGRLEGPWNTDLKVVKSGGGSLTVGTTWTDTWSTQPRCTAGACTVTLTGHISPPTYYQRGFTVTLTRSGAVYTGTTTAHITDCSSIAVHNVLTFRITVGQAGVFGQQWLATSWSGTLKMDSPYTSAGGSYYCPAQSRTFSIAGSP